MENIKAINDHAQGERRESLMTLPAHYRWHSVNTTCNANRYNKKTTILK
ncbi:TPA: hypothetical protein SO907_004121 [Yersinia enterocolitica]|nr:hypothetical protein [Yersinia enterocolitica]